MSTINLEKRVVDQVEAALARLAFQSGCGVGGATPELRDAISFCESALGALRRAMFAAREQGSQDAPADAVA